MHSDDDLYPPQLPPALQRLLDEIKAPPAPLLGNLRQDAFYQRAHLYQTPRPVGGRKK